MKNGNKLKAFKQNLIFFMMGLQVLSYGGKLRPRMYVFDCHRVKRFQYPCMLDIHRVYNNHAIKNTAVEENSLVAATHKRLRMCHNTKVFTIYNIIINKNINGRSYNSN